MMVSPLPLSGSYSLAFSWDLNDLLTGCLLTLNVRSCRAPMAVGPQPAGCGRQYLIR